MLRGGTHEPIHVAHHATQHFAGRAGRARVEHVQQARCRHILFALIQGFHQAIGEDHQPIALLQDQVAGFIAGFCLDPEWQSTDRQSFHGSGAAPENGCVVSGIDVGESPVHRIVLRQESGGEAQSSLAVGAGILVHPRDQFGQRTGDGGEGLEAGLKGHKSGCASCWRCRARGTPSQRESRDSGPTPAQRRRAELDAKVATFHAASDGVYGAPRILADLRDDGETVSRKTVAASLRRQGLAGISPRRFAPATTVVDLDAAVPKDLVKRRFDTGILNRVWTSDITYLGTGEGWLYLCAVRDHSHER